MIDNLIYCSNLTQFRVELEANGYTDTDEEGNTVYTHGNNNTPPYYSVGDESVCLVRDNKLDLALFPSLTNLGTYDEMFADTTAHNLYKYVYPYDVPIGYIDDEGNPQSYFRPTRIGEFA